MGTITCPECEKTDFTTLKPSLVKCRLCGHIWNPYDTKDQISRGDA